MSKHIYTMLCLGDSYTIGEGVPLHLSFPYQALQMLRRKGIAFHAPEIVAQTGWTTFELAEHLIHHALQPQYDFVTLLIGVNNQYRSLSAGDFAEDYEFLLKKAVSLCAEHHTQVLAISIPDWGITPFAKDHDRAAIAASIDAFNEKASMLAAKYKIAWLDITAHYRENGAATGALAEDGLHPSGAVYAHWAQNVTDFVSSQV